MRKRVRAYVPRCAYSRRINGYIRAVYAHTDGVNNERLLAYFSSALTRMKKRHERGVVPRPEWCSPVRWRMFAGWLRTREDAKALVRATQEQKTGAEVWREQIKREWDNKKAKKAKKG